MTVVSLFASCLILTLLPYSAYAQETLQLRKGHLVVDFTPADLKPVPSAEAIARARKAYFNGDVVRIVGGTATDVKRLIGVNVATSVSQRDGGAGAVYAIQKTNRMIRQYTGQAASVDGHGRPQKDKTFEIWRDEADASVGDPAGPSQAWTLVQQNTYQQGTDSSGGVAYYAGSTNYTTSIYRLNSKQTDFDYYMVLQDSNVTPNYLPPCYAVLIGSCGWWTDSRKFTISAGANSVLTDHGPTGTITSETAGFSIGGSLGLNGPGVSAGFSMSWSQPAVTTTDLSTDTSASWSESFTARIATSDPPPTSRGTFLSHQGAIFQLPFGQSFTLNLSNSARFIFLGAWGENTYDPQTSSLSINIPVDPPILTMSPSTLTIAPGEARVATVTASIPNSIQGLGWQLSVQPSQGIAISETTGAESKSLILTVEPGQAIGTTWEINLQTSPPYGAPSVALNPVRVTVIAGAPPPLSVEGVLIAGGESNGTPIASAEVFDFNSNSMNSVGPLSTARYSHSATELSDGKVLVTGGQVSSDSTVATATAELYDPDTQSFAPLQGATNCPGAPGCMAFARFGHTATLLPTGKLLIVGGQTSLNQTTNTAEIYDPANKRFTLTGSMLESRGRAGHAATWIPEQNKVLISGGYYQQGTLTQIAVDSTEYYDPATGEFTQGPKLPVAQAVMAKTTSGPCVTCLIGDMSSSNHFSSFSAQTNSWIAATPLLTGRYGATASPLGNSGLLVAGGSTLDSQFNPIVVATAEINSLSSNVWGNWTYTSNTSTCPGSAGCLVTARANHTASVLPDGQVLLTGGYDNSGKSLATSEVFNPASQSFTLGPSLSTARALHTATRFRAANLSTKTALASSQNPSIYGQSITYTATVTSNAGGTPDGTVTFNDGSSVLGKVTLIGGSASFTAPSLSGGTHPIQAAYSGSASYAASSSSALNQTISLLAPAVAVHSSANPSASGEAVTFTASVLSNDGTPQGTVDFLDNTAVIATVALQDGGAQYTTNTLVPGTHSITAKYNGDGNFQAGVSPAISQSISIKTQTTLVSQLNPSSQGQNISFTASVISAGGTPAGTIDFVVDAKVVAPGVVMQNGSANYQTDQLMSGNHILLAVYKPGPGLAFSGSTSPSVTQTVLNQTTTTVTSNLNPTGPGTQVTFQATVSAASGMPTGTVDFADGGTVLASRIPVSNSIAVYTTLTLQPGSHSITATYRPDASTSFSGSVSKPLAQVILSGTSTILASSVNPSSHGQQVTFTASVSSSASGTPTGTISFTDGGTTLGQVPLTGGKATLSIATLTQGAHALVAQYSGDSGNGGSKSPVFTQTVNLTTPTVTLASSQNPARQGQSVTFTATVTGPTGTTPTGTVVFLDGARTLGLATLSGTMVSYTNSTLTAGAHSLTAVYQGDSNFTQSASQPVNQVMQATPVATTTTLAASPNPSTFGQSVTLTATATSASGTSVPVGSVQFLDGGTTSLGMGSLINGRAQLTTAALVGGNHVLTAVYSGNETFSPSTSMPVNQQILVAQCIPSTVVISANPNPSAAGQTITFTAAVSWTDGGTPSGNVSISEVLDGQPTKVLGTSDLQANGTAVVPIQGLGAGTHVIYATYGGEPRTNHCGSTSQGLSQSVTAGQ